METKKSPKADLQSKRGLFLEIGLLAAIGVMILAFNWGSSSKVIEAIGTYTDVVVIDLPPLAPDPPKEITQPRASVQVISDVIQAVRNDVKIEVDPKFTIDDGPTIPIPGENSGVGSDDDYDDVPVFFTADGAKFQGGGIDRFFEWVSRQIANNYPSAARTQGIQGTVLVSFIIEKDGTLSNITVLQSPSPILSRAVVELLGRSPKWTPAKQGRLTVRQGMQQAFNFHLK